jgi:hypothetical protein
VDVLDLQHCVTQLRALSDQTRRAAGETAAGRAVDWKSLAANKFRDLLDEEANRARRCAALLDEAADAVAAHARATGAA